MEDWFNRIGLTLQLVALFLVTPEIIGTDNIADFYARLAPGYRRLIVSTNWRWIIGIGAVAVIFGAAPFVIKAVAPAHTPLLLIALASTVFMILGPALLAWIAIWLWRLLLRIGARVFSVGAFVFAIGYVLLIAATFHPGR